MAKQKTETKMPTAKKDEPKPKKEKAPKENLVVFALRMSESDRVALHKAAGPANACRTMRALAGAFVSEDRAVFESIIEEARRLRA